MKRIIVFIVVTGTMIVACLSYQTRGQKNADGDANGAAAAYRLEVGGTPGTRIRMLLVTKPSATANPERREEVITVPAVIDFTTARCYGWFDALPEGGGGQDGDAFSAKLLRNGLTTAELQMNIKAANRQGGGLGDL